MAAINNRLQKIFRFMLFARGLPTHARCIHSTLRTWKRDVQTVEKEKFMILKSSTLFDELAERKAKDKETFQIAIDMYIAKETLYRRGHVEFLYAALTKMKDFGVHRDLSVYKQLLDVFPKGKMIPRSSWQVELMHYPKQQQCGIDIMEQMEDNGVIPDLQFGKKLASIFGTEAHVFRKYRRIMYWLPKFRNANPYPVPYHLPDDAIELAILALKRMAVDLENKITVWKTKEVEENPVEDTFIASAVSPEQQKLIARHPADKPVFVEGGHTVWTRYVSQTYFVLRADPSEEYLNLSKVKDEDDDLFEWNLPFNDEKPSELMRKPSIHEQDDGSVLGMCITGTSTKDSLVTWIRYLQQDNPHLENVPVVFTLKTPEGQIQVVKTGPKESQVQTGS